MSSNSAAIVRIPVTTAFAHRDRGTKKQKTMPFDVLSTIQTTFCKFVYYYIAVLNGSNILSDFPLMIPAEYYGQKRQQRTRQLSVYQKNGQHLFCLSGIEQCHLLSLLIQISFRQIHKHLSNLSPRRSSQRIELAV